MKDKNILIVGYGEIGKALNKLLNKSKVKIFIYDKNDKKNNVLQHNIYDIIFLTVPSWNLIEAIKTIKPIIKSNTIVVTISKGIEIKTKLLPFEVVNKYLPNNEVAHIAGPMLAEDIMKGNISGAIIGTANKKTFILLENILQSEKFILKYSKDIRSISLAGVIKNIYSLFFGILSAGKVGDNSFGVYIPQVIKEMQIITKNLNGDQGVVLTMAGIGDFIATAFSPYSSNRKRGLELIRGTKKLTKCESIDSLKIVYIKTKSKRDYLPILKELYKLVY